MATQKLNAVITIGGTLSSSFKTTVFGAKSRLNDLGKTLKDLTKRQTALGDAIKKTGSTGRYVSGLTSEYSRLSSQIERTRKQQDRLHDAMDRRAKAAKIGGALVMAGAKTTAFGVGIGAAFVPGVREAKAYQGEQARVRALGMGEKANRDANAFARQMRTFGTSQLENLTLVRDAMSVFGDVHHAQMVAPTLAKMKFANSAVFGADKGAENESKFLDMLKVIELRGGTKSQSAFNTQANMVQRVISATGGRVGPDEWRHMISTGGLAAKSMRDDAFYYQMEPLVQEMGGDRVGTGLMSGYSSLYQGRTTTRAVRNLEKFGLIGDRSKVQSDKAGQISHIDPGALKGAAIFRQSQFEWMKTVLIPTLAEKGVTSKDQVLDAIGSIFSGRKGADLMAAMFLQQTQIEKNERVNRGAADIDRLDAEGRNSVQGKETIARKRLDDAKLRAGNAVLPMYVTALDTFSGALERLNKFTDRHPRWATVLTDGVAGIGAAAVVAGPPLIVAGGILRTISTIRLVRAATGITEMVGAMNGVEGAAAGAAGGIGRFTKFLGSVGLAYGIAQAVDAAAGKFGIGKGKIDQKQDDANWKRMNWFERGVSSLGRGQENIERRFGLTNLPNGSQANRIKLETRLYSGRIPPVMSAPRAAAPIINNNNTFHIVQQPGQSVDKLADEIAKKLAAKARTQRGSLLYDRATG